jgi:hypothetical protein
MHAMGAIQRGAIEWVMTRGRAKVTSVYVEDESISAECTEFFHDLEAGRRTERAMNRADAGGK